MIIETCTDRILLERMLKAVNSQIARTEETKESEESEEPEEVVDKFFLKEISQEKEKVEKRLKELNKI